MSERKIEIKPPWKGLSDQSVTGANGCKWIISDLIERTKGLEVMDVPLIHMSQDYKINGMLLREFIAHMRLVLEADMDCPVIMDEDGCLFDGRHRMARAILEGQTSIKAVRFDEDPPPTIAGGSE